MKPSSISFFLTTTLPESISVRSGRATRETSKSSASWPMPSTTILGMGLNPCSSAPSLNRSRLIEKQAPSPAKRAPHSSVVSMVLRGAFVQIVVGLACGVPIALLAARLLDKQLYGIHPGNPLVLAAAVVILAGSAAVAGFIPARRAARIDPMVALRYE